MTTPTAKLIAELRELANSTDRAVIEKECWEYADPLRRAAEALARQEELLAEAGKVVAEAAGDIEGWGAYAGDYFKDKHNLAGDVERYRRAAARLSDKLKGE